MKTPSFWHADGFIPKLLEPLAQVYKHLGFLERSFRSKTKIGIPVLCVGNIVSGGAGKTCLLYTSPSPRDATLSRMPSSA